MAGPSSSDNQGGDLEARFFFAVLKHMKNKPDTDWEAVAEDMGYTNANTAQVSQTKKIYGIVIPLIFPQTRFGQIKRKLGLKIGKPASPNANKVTKTGTPKKQGPMTAAGRKPAATTKAPVESDTGSDSAAMEMPDTPTPACMEALDDDEV